MNKFITWIIGIVATLALILSIGNAVGGNNQPVFLGAEGDTNFTNLVAERDITAGSDFISTKSGFCFNFYATSTATLGKMTASTTATIEGVDGVMMFEYGSCQS